VLFAGCSEQPDRNGNQAEGDIPLPNCRSHRHTPEGKYRGYGRNRPIS
jgi:hypothetical protein